MQTNNKLNPLERIVAFFTVIAVLLFVFWMSNELFGVGFHNLTNAVGNGLIWLLK